MADKILFVDDDPNILAAFHRQLRKVFALETAQGGTEGLDAVARRGPFSVIVSDLRMPEMDGIQFLARVRSLAPDTVRMMLTGNADLHAAVAAVNEGHIFRFLTKPCAPEVLVKALSAGLEQYHLITAERELLEKTLRGTIKLLSDMLALVNPEAFGRATRITRLTKKIAHHMELDDVWQVETAASLSQLGCVMLPQEALKKLSAGQPLTAEEVQLYSMHPFIASDLLVNIPRMQGIAEIIAYQQKCFDGSGIPHEDRKGEGIPLGARILKVIIDYDTLEAAGMSKADILLELKNRTGQYDPKVMAALKAVIRVEEGYEVRQVSVGQLADGMILTRDVLTRDGRLLIARGYQVSQTMRERLKHFILKPGISEPISVLVYVTEKTEAPHTFSRSKGEA